MTSQPFTTCVGTSTRTRKPTVVRCAGADVRKLRTAESAGVPVLRRLRRSVDPG
jgi:hypothetical protein